MTRATLRDQWPDALLFLAAALKAGLTIEGAMDLLVEAAPPPLRNHLEKTWRSASWSSTKERVERLLADPSLTLAKTALVLTGEAGGSVSEVLEKAANLLKTKNEMENKVHTLTLQGKVSAWVVGVSPFLLMGGFLLIAPDYLTPLFTTKLGWKILCFIIVMVILGLFFVHRAAKMEG